MCQSRASVPASGNEQTLIYKSVNGRDIHLDFLPPLARVYDRAPVYFIIPGGGWSGCDRKSMLQMCALSVEQLRQRGLAVVSTAYRLVDDGVFMDDYVADVMDAARYIRKYEAVLGVDAGRLLIAGHSAGGQLALMAAYAPRDLFAGDPDLAAWDYGVMGVVPLSAPTILFPEADGRYLFGEVFTYMFAHADDPVKGMEEARRGSPITYAGDRQVPTLVITGDSDPLVFPENSRRFHRAVLAAGGDSRLLLCRGGGHCFEPMDPAQPVDPDWAKAQEELVRFAEGLL